MKFNLRKYQRKCDRHHAHKILHECYEYAKVLTGCDKRNSMLVNTDILRLEDLVK